MEIHLILLLTAKISTPTIITPPPTHDNNTIELAMKNTTLEVGKNFRFHFVHLSFPFFLAVFTFPYQHQHETLFIDCRCFLQTVVFSSPTRHDVAEEKKKSPHLALLVCGARGCVFCCRMCRREKIFRVSFTWLSFDSVPECSRLFSPFLSILRRHFTLPFASCCCDVNIHPPPAPA